jgi:Protein of unknown function (DUF1573)
MYMRRIGLACAVLMIGSGGVLAVWGWRMTPSGPACVVVDKDGYNWGRVKPGSKVETTFLIRNSGAERLILREPGVTCGCTKPTLPVRELAPGESTAMLVSFQVPVDHGPVSHVITIPTSDPQRPTVELILSANSWVGVLPVPQSLELGTLRPGDSVERTLQFYSPDHKPFRLLRVSCDLPEVNVVSEDGDNVLAVHRVKATYRAGSRLGSVRGHIQASTDQLDAQLIELPIAAQTSGPILSTPTSLAIDRGEIGKIKKLSLLLRTVAPETPMELASVRASEPWEVVDYQVAKLRDPGHVMLELSLRFPRGNGSPSGDLVLEFAKPQAAELSIPLAIRGWTPVSPSSR